MELLNMGHTLRRRRLFVAVGLIISLALGAKVGGVLNPGGTSGSAMSGQALTRVLIDTPAPLLATSVAKGADTIVQRTVLLASLMGSSQTTAVIARQAGVPSDQLSVVGPALDPVTVVSYSPAGQFPLSASTSAALAGGAKRFVVQLTPVAMEPVISVSASAPNVREAAALAQATVAALKSVSASAGGAYGTLRIEPMDSVHGVPMSRANTSHRVRGAAAAFVMFLVWCVAIVIGSGLARRWRGATRPVTESAA